MAGRLIKILKIAQSFQLTPECEECQIRLPHLISRSVLTKWVYVSVLLLFEISCTMYLRVFNYSNSTPIDNSTECHWAILSQL